VNVLGGWKVQGKTAEAAASLLDDAMALEDAGCFSVVLESVPTRLAEHITARLEVPTIGIGAGPRCSGQVLVYHDLLGLFDRFKPKFVKRFAELGPVVEDAVRTYMDEVRAGTFPDNSNAYHMDDQEWTRFLDLVGPSSATANQPLRADVRSTSRSSSRQT
jgi:3-methyl-2-oxobutanoate hydroxymethyltransferase